MKCMVVDGGLFYDSIEGFDYEEGYVYRLKIEWYDAWPGREEPPQDAGVRVAAGGGVEQEGCGVGGFSLNSDLILSN